MPRIARIARLPLPRVRGGRSRLALLAAAALALLATVACGDDDGETLTVYSGRSEALIGPILERFAEESGISVAVRYGGSAELAATIREEAEANTVRADVFIAQDAGALGAVQRDGLMRPLPDDILDRVPAAFRADDGGWVGLSGRVRVLVYHTPTLTPDDLPASILDLTDPRWRGRVGWAPANGSFQAWVTALRLLRGEDAAREWLVGMRDNGVTEYPNNAAIVEAVGRGEVEVGLVNHYYLARFIAEQGEAFPARNALTADGDIGTLVNVAGAGILAATDHPGPAEELLRFLLADEAQHYFAEETAEYPLVAGVPGPEGNPPLDTIRPVELDLSDLDDLEGTLRLLREVDVLP